MDILDNESGRSANENQLSTSARSDLRRTYPWMNFVAIAGYVLSIGYVLLMLFVLMKMQVPGMAFALIFYCLFGALYFYISYLLHRHGLGYKNYLLKGESRELDNAISAGQKFWMITGILMIIGLIFGLIGMIGFVAAISTAPDAFPF